MQKTRVIVIENFIVQTLGHRGSFATLSLVFYISKCIIQKTLIFVTEFFAPQTLGYAYPLTIVFLSFVFQHA